MQTSWLLSVGLLPLLLLGLWFLPVSIRLRWQSGTAGRREVQFVFLGIFCYRLPLGGRRKPGGDGPGGGWAAVLQGAAQVRTILPRLRVQRFLLRIRLGTGDAAGTGVATGVLYGLVCGLLTPLLPKLPPEHSRVQVEPVFHGVGWELECDSRMSLPLGNLILFVAERRSSVPAGRSERKKPLFAKRKA